MGLGNLQFGAIEKRPQEGPGEGRLADAEATGKGDEVAADEAGGEIGGKSLGGGFIRQVDGERLLRHGAACYSAALAATRGRSGRFMRTVDPSPSTESILTVPP